MYANVEVQHATSVHNSLARTSHTSDALSTYHTGTGKHHPKMRLDRNNEWTAIITASVFMTKCSEEQKKKILPFFSICASFLLHPEANRRPWQLVEEEAYEERSICCLPKALFNHANIEAPGWYTRMNMLQEHFCSFF